ncbi:MAG TPA: hypothetical protein VF573_02060 [Paraburkholderia sp.]|uniref:hypothetical protein n=1 Tax=Paraburkholderia sp. TaxID=1926495 RepID=UPI002ED5427B
MQGYHNAVLAGVLPTTTNGLNVQLTPSEREALEKAVSAEYLEKQGLREGTMASLATSDHKLCTGRVEIQNDGCMASEAIDGRSIGL